MLLLERDAKVLLARRGLPVPRGELLAEGSTSCVPGPWMVKAQVPNGGRGKAGGIRRASTAAAGRLIAEAFLDLDATLLELNPLLVLPDGSWLAGDVRMAVDETALPRQPSPAP